MEIKGIRVNITAIPIPMGCSPAFEGKSIRKEEMYVEFGGGRSPAFELFVHNQPLEVKDGQVTVIGPEIEAMKEGGAYPLAIIIHVAGKMMKQDYDGSWRDGFITLSITGKDPGMLPSGISSGCGSPKRLWPKE